MKIRLITTGGYNGILNIVDGTTVLNARKIRVGYDRTAYVVSADEIKKLAPSAQLPPEDTEYTFYSYECREVDVFERIRLFLAGDVFGFCFVAVAGLYFAGRIVI